MSHEFNSQAWLSSWTSLGSTKYEWIKAWKKTTAQCQTHPRLKLDPNKQIKFEQYSSQLVTYINISSHEYHPHRYSGYGPYGTVSLDNLILIH